MTFAWLPPVAYLIGSIPFGLLIGLAAKGIDLRQAGSGNIGATNAYRVLGSRWGILVFLLDLAKGAGPVLFARSLAAHDHSLQVMAGLFAVLGHMFPCWLGFRGGKGVATALGTVIVLAPTGCLIAAAIFATTFAVTRIVSLGSMLGALAFAVVQMSLLAPNPFRTETAALAAFSLVVPALIVLRHASNIARLWRGEEHAVGSPALKAEHDAAAHSAKGETSVPDEHRPS